MLDDLLNLGNIHFQVLVALKLTLHGHNVLRVPNLSIVHCLEVLLELVQFGSEFLPLRLDVR